MAVDPALCGSESTLSGSGGIGGPTDVMPADCCRRLHSMLRSTPPHASLCQATPPWRREAMTSIQSGWSCTQRVRSVLSPPPGQGLPHAVPQWPLESPPAPFTYCSPAVFEKCVQQLKNVVSFFGFSNYYHYYYYCICLTTFFQDHLGKPAPEKQNHYGKTNLDLLE